MAEDSSPPFRFYDNRQKYLAFVTTCNEKSAIAHRATHEVTLLRPTPPAVRLFDAGMGDGTVITRVMRATHWLLLAAVDTEGHLALRICTCVLDSHQADPRVRANASVEERKGTCSTTAQRVTCANLSDRLL